MGATGPCVAATSLTVQRRLCDTIAQPILVGLSWLLFMLVSV